MEKSTIYDYARFMHEYCHANTECADCPLKNLHCGLENADSEELAKINEIILNWCKEHPVKTRQDEFLKMFPNAKVDTNGILDACPYTLNTNNKCTANQYGECRKEYWLAEVEE